MDGEKYGMEGEARFFDSPAIQETPEALSPSRLPRRFVFMELQAMKASLEWQIACGADEAILDAPIDRTALPKAVEPQRRAPARNAAPETDAAAVARAAASAAVDLAMLRTAMEAYELCDLKRGAKQLVFSDGNASARVMIIGEAPGRDEDIEGRPFVGRAGQLLDLMFSHIGLFRTESDSEKALYIANVLPWRPPQNRDPKPEEMKMMLPFLERHVELVDPDLIVAMGNHACLALLGQRGITRLRGNWKMALGRPTLPMFHPAYLLRTPEAKRETWADLLSLKDRLRK